MLSVQTRVITTSYKPTIASLTLKLATTRRRDGFAVDVCTVRRLKVYRKRPLQCQYTHIQQGKKNLLDDAF